MRRTKLVLAVAVVMVTILVVFSAPALADNRHHDNWKHWNNWGWNNNWNNWGWNNWNNQAFFDDDCEWEFEEGWFWGHWGWQWGMWVLDC